MEWHQNGGKRGTYGAGTGHWSLENAMEVGKGQGREGGRGVGEGASKPGSVLRRLGQVELHTEKINREIPPQCLLLFWGGAAQLLPVLDCTGPRV